MRTVGTQNLVEAMLYSAASRTWTGPTVLSAEGSAYPALDVAVDASGNALAVWSRAYVQPCGFLCLQGARYVAAARMWTLTDDLSHPLQAAYNPQVQFDGHGNAVTVWGQSFMGYSATQARTWRATPSAPTLTGVSAAPGTLTLAFLPPETSEAQFAPVNYAYSIDDGATWTTRDPASTASPLVVGGLQDGIAYPVRLRAINTAGAAAVSAKVVAVAGAGPQTPSGLVTTSVTGNLVTLEWAPPSAGLVPAAYVVEGGMSPGEVLASLPTGSAAPRFTFVAPTGAFYVRVHAVADGVRSGPSNEILLVVNAVHAAFGASRPSGPGRWRRSGPVVDEHVRGWGADQPLADRDRRRHDRAAAADGRDLHISERTGGNLYARSRRCKRGRRQPSVERGDAGVSGSLRWESAGPDECPGLARRVDSSPCRGARRPAAPQRAIMSRR